MRSVATARQATPHFDAAPASEAPPRGIPPRLLLAACLLYLPFLTLGYGSDNDTYGVLDAAHYWLSWGVYSPSRNPGFVVHELVTGVLDRLGGSLATNLASLYFGVLALRAFWSLAAAFDVPHRTLLAAVMIVHPLFWIASTSTHDYVWALGLGLAGLAAFARGESAAAALCLGLAIATRITSAIYLVALVAAWPGRRALGVGTIAAFVGGAAYLLPFSAADWSLEFLTPGIFGPEYLTPYLRFGRFFYKNIYFWGLPALIVLSVAAVRTLDAPLLLRRREWLAGVRLAAAIILPLQVLFLKFPLEPSYLLPTLPAMLLLVGMACEKQPNLAVALVIAVLSFDVINLNLARPNVPDRASDAGFGVWLEPGGIVTDTKARIRLLGCDSFDCWDRIVRGGRPAWWTKP